MNQPPQRRYDALALHTFVVDVLVSWGMRSDTAETTATVMVDTDLSGIDSHGISMLMMYERLHLEQRLRVSAEPSIVVQTPAFSLLDAKDGLGHPVAVQGMNIAMEAARVLGIGAVAVRNSHHFGAAGYYVRQAADAGLLGLVTSTTRTPVVAATGGTIPVLGTNPLAFAAPRVFGGPLVVDISTSVVAMNKVKAYGLQGRSLPDGWVTDRDGRTLNDAEKAFALLTSDGASLSPLGGSTTATGGHKGFGLSLMVQILSAALSGAAAPGHDGDHDNIGHFFMAIDPEIINPDGAAAADVERLLTSVVDGESNVLIPGQPEEDARAERGRLGIPVPASLERQLVTIGRRADVDWPAPCSDADTGESA